MMPPSTVLRPAICCLLLCIVVHRIEAAAVRPATANDVVEATAGSDETPQRPTASRRSSKEAKLPAIEDNNIGNTPEDGGNEPDLQAQPSRQHKMLDYFGLSDGGGYYAPPAALYPSPYSHPYFAQNYYDAPQPAYSSPYGAAAAAASNEATGSDDDDVDDLMMGRANRRKPGGGQSSRQNSPIFYIRLPPTPYMYVPGMGYISQPPSIRPMAQQFPAMLAAPAPPPPPPPPPSSQSVNPFINVPVSFLANGKPTNVYEWPGSAPQSSQGSGYAGPQYPSYLPARPLQPSRPPGYRPGKPAAYLPDSKITHLKGPYVFNGRPEEIYVLPQNNGPPPSPYGGYGGHRGDYGPPSYQQPHMGYHAPLPYGDAYNSIYSNQLFHYY